MMTPSRERRLSTSSRHLAPRHATFNRFSAAADGQAIAPENYAADEAGDPTRCDSYGIDWDRIDGDSG